jgi:PAS domain-containing protein
MRTAALDHYNEYGRQVQDRLGAALHHLASLDLSGSGREPRRSNERLTADVLRKVSAELERALVEVREASVSYERLRVSASQALQRADLLFLLSPVPCLILDRTSQVIDANPAAARAVNLSQRHLIGRSLELFVGSDRSEFLERLAALERDAWATRWPVTIRPRERGLLRVIFTAVVDQEDHIVAMLLPLDAASEDLAPAHDEAAATL